LSSIQLGNIKSTSSDFHICYPLIEKKNLSALPLVSTK
jgi:hypothetical protein